MGKIEKAIYCLVIGIFVTALGCFVFFWVISEERGMIVPQEAKNFFAKRCANFGQDVKVGSLIAFKEEDGQKITGTCIRETLQAGGVYHQEQIDYYDIVIRNTK